MADKSNNPAANSLGVPDGKQSGSKRKMTAAIIEDQKQEDENYAFLEEDDDFEEFELGTDYDEYLAAGQADAVMRGSETANSVENDRKVWQQDWDDEEVEEDFGARLRAELHSVVWELLYFVQIKNKIQFLG